MTGVSRYLVSPLALWDGGWYGRIVVEGYGGSKATAAFWPLYPTLVDLISTVTRLSPEASGILLSSLAFLGALRLLFRLVDLTYGLAIATRTVWLLALNPIAYFFAAFYTESLFLLLSVGALLCARQARWSAAATLALLATLTRSAGVLVLLPLGIILLRQFRDRNRVALNPIVQLAAAALGPVAFAVHLDHIWGDRLLMIHAQERWHRRFTLPWESLWDGLRRLELIYVSGRQECLDIAQGGGWAACRDALQISSNALSDDLAGAAAIIALALLPVVVRRLDLADAFYGIALLLMALTSGIPDDPLVSLPRYLLVAFPLTVALAMVVRSRWLFVITVCASTICLCWLLSIFASAWFVA